MTVSYTTIERIAVGGMGEVFLSRQEGLGGFRRTVVTKRLLPDAEGDDDTVRRFLDEARVAGALSHENVVSILEVGDDGAPFLALEYVHGENAGQLRIKARKKGVQFPVVVVARIIADAARGLAHAHDAHDVDGSPLRIVHRDVAPKNIFVRADGVSKIGDFGIAKSDHRLSRTATGQVPGTLSYMSPEQARGAVVDARSDQFSLGIVLWELLVGQPLFKAVSPQETLRNVLEKKIRRPSTLRPDAAALDLVARTMLARDPAKRYTSLADAAAAIEEALPETRAELGQRAVAMFVETVAGDELRDRQRRIELGPEATARVDRTRHDSASFPPITPSPFADSQSDTPVTGAVDTTTPVSALVATANARPLRAAAARTSPPRRLRAALSIGAVVALSVAAVAIVAPMVARRAGPTPDDRTRAYLAEARAANPLLHRAVFLAMAELAHVDEKRAAPVADKLIAALDKRLALLDAQAKRPAAARTSTAVEERALLEQARAALAGLGDDDLASQELDMWDYDSSAPLRWMPPDPASVIQRDLADGGLAFVDAQAPMRTLATNRLLALAKLDPKAVHAWLDPLVAEREQLVRQSATAPEAQLVALDRRILALHDDGAKRLKAVAGAVMGHAIAEVAFETVSSPDEWTPLFDTPPSARDSKPPATH